MNVGLPGTGLAGLFYLITALLMPLLELSRALAGKSSPARWRVVGMQTSLALGVIGGLWMTAWGVHALLPRLSDLLRQTAHRTTDWLGVAPTIVTFSTLACVLMMAEVLRLALVRGGSRA